MATELVDLRQGWTSKGWRKCLVLAALTHEKSMIEDKTRSWTAGFDLEL
jgi:hypothetical protein